MATDWNAARTAAVRRCMKAGASREDAEDCAQEALLSLVKLLRKQATATVIATPEAWLVAVAHRRYLDLCRRRSREQRTQALIDSPAVTPGADRNVVGRSEARELLLSLFELPEVTQQVCWLVLQGRAVSEIATKLELTRRSVEAHLWRARSALRQRPDRSRGPA